MYILRRGWFTPEELQEGDIFETPSKVPSNSPIFPGMLVGAVKHVGVICKIEEELWVAHAPFGGYPCLERASAVFQDRGVEKVLRTGTPTEKILERLEQIKYSRYCFFFRNCEDTSQFLCGGVDLQKPDQRRGYALVLFTFLFLIILLLILRK